MTPPLPSSSEMKTLEATISKSSNHLLFKIQPLLDILYFMVITNQFINDQMTRCVRPLQSLDENVYVQCMPSIVIWSLMWAPLQWSNDIPWTPTSIIKWKCILIPHQWWNDNIVHPLQWSMTMTIHEHPLQLSNENASTLTSIMIYMIMHVCPHLYKRSTNYKST